MKKIFLYSLILSLFCGVFTSCEEETEDISGITYYVTINLEGESTVYHEKGTPWVDPGYSATEGEDDVTANVVVTVPDVNSLGSYTLTYSAVNSDGYSGSVTRKVVVYSPGLSDVDISGTYTADVFRTRSDGGADVKFSGNEVVISKTGVDGLFYISDWIGGFYNVGYGYGEGYAFTGYLEMISETEFHHIESVNPWGDPADEVINWNYNAAAGTFSYDFMWLSKYDFAVSMTKVE